MNSTQTLKRVAPVLAVWSFTALVTTGQLAGIPVVIVYGIYALLFCRRDLFEKIPPNAWLIANILAIPVAIFFGYRDLGDMLVYGTVYLQLHQLVRGKKPRDYVGLFGISFFQVVLASAISTELVFSVVLLGFFVLAIIGMSLLTLEHSRLQVARQSAQLCAVGRPLTNLAGSRARPAPASPNPINTSLPMRGYAFTMTTFSLGVLFVTFLLFMAIPRLAVRKVFFDLRPFEANPVTGFTDQVELGRLGSIAKNRTEVMRVWIDRRQSSAGWAPSYLRMRGVALDAFDGTRWRPSHWARGYNSRLVDMQARVRFPTPARCDPSRRVKINIVQNTRLVKWLFGPPYITALQLGQPADIIRYGQLHSFQAEVRPMERFRYYVFGTLEPSVPQIRAQIAAYKPTGKPPRNMTTAELIARSNPTSAVWTMPAKELEHYLLLPRIHRDQPILDLAREITRDAQTPFDRVSRLNRFFHTDFEYSLETQPANPNYYLWHFLLRERKAHCETFATAMAVMCRMLEIPSRVVSGFYTTEFNHYVGFFYVRQCNAHTWVEVWLDGYGWMTVDPTPPSALVGSSGRLGALAALVRDYWDSLTMRWRRFVIDYSLTDQLGFLQKLTRGLGFDHAYRARDRSLIPARHALKNWIAKMKYSNEENGYALHKVSLAGLVVAWVVYRRQQRRNGRRPKKPGEQPRALHAVEFYLSILKALARQGCTLRCGETPAEFAHAVVATRPELGDLVPVTHTYYRVRFAQDDLRTDERQRARTLLAEINNRRRRRRALARSTSVT